jgi:hypothetical protein
MAAANGFTFEARKSGEVVIRHVGSVAAVLRGERAARFLTEATTADDIALQARMARLSGNYKRGNERQARR